MAKIYVIASGKGGVGKTTSAINLGAALNSFNKDVIVVDANLTTPNIGLHLGALNIPVSLNHVLNGEAEIEEAIYEHESGTKIIPSSLSVKELKKVRHDRLYDIASELRKIADHIIFDSAAGLGNEAIAAISAGDEVIIIANPNILSVTDALKTIKVADDLKKKIKGAIITRVAGKKIEMPLESIKEMLEIPILGIVPEDKAVGEALNRKNVVMHTHPKSKASKAYKRIAAEILGKQYVKQLERSQSGFRKILKAIGLG